MRASQQEMIPQRIKEECGVHSHKSGDHIQTVDDDDKGMDTVENNGQTVHEDDDLRKESTKQGNGVLHVTIDRQRHQNHRPPDGQVLRHELEKVKESEQNAADLDEHPFR